MAQAFCPCQTSAMTCSEVSDRPASHWLMATKPRIGAGVIENTMIRVPAIITVHNTALAKLASM